MKKLNNGGWGFIVFIIYLFILLFAILVVLYLANSLELGIKTSRGVAKVTNEQRVLYKKYESSASLAAKDYVKEFSLSDGETRFVNIDSLNLRDTIYIQCIGYVKITNLYDIYSYRSYLKCGDYTTFGYEENRI